MELETAVWTGFGLVAGAVVSWILSKYYFHRTQQFTRLSAAVMGQSRVIRTPEKYGGDLEVRYKGHPVKELHQLHLFIGNSGNKPVMASGHPLKIEIPGDYEIVDYQISRREPSERTIVLQSFSKEKGGSILSVDFALLNANEHFTIKLLSLQEIKSKDIMIHSELPDVPAAFSIEQLPIEWYAPAHDHPKFKGRAIAIVAGMLLAVMTVLLGRSALDFQGQAVPIWGISGIQIGNLLMWFRIGTLWVMAVILGVACLAALAEAVKFRVRWGKHVPCFKLEHERRIPHIADVGSIRPKVD
ncbi:MAG: hypothetical protein QOG31_1751 [Thermoplasmata archaeon]|jgi:hypothetical protein|nr:hypothetical protein [Thermoplasmata archaeon]